MENPLVTVVVPVYNVEKYLDRCIESIVSQTYRNLEIILVDDGSPDRCPQLCDEWAKKDLRIQVIHKQNQGLGMARNTGIRAANGEYICFFDSDDYVDENVVERAYQAINQQNADLAIFGYQSVFENKRKDEPQITMRKTVFSGTEITKELLPWMIQWNRRREQKCEFPFSAWSGMVRRDILTKHQLLFRSERQIISEDTVYLLQLYSKLHTVVLIPERLYFYRVNPASLTKRYRKDRQEKNNAFLSCAHEIVKEEQYSDEVWLRIMMLYQGFSMEGMKHIIRMENSHAAKRKLLAAYFDDEQLNQTITKETATRSGIRMGIFLLCLKWKLQLPCYLLLLLREKLLRQ